MLCFETCQQLLVYFHWCCRRVSTVVSATLIYFLFFSLFLIKLYFINVLIRCLKILLKTPLMGVVANILIQIGSHPCLL